MKHTSQISLHKIYVPFSQIHIHKSKNPTQRYDNSFYLQYSLK